MPRTATCRVSACSSPAHENRPNTRWIPNARSAAPTPDYLAFVATSPDVSVVEMDSVIGRKGGKVLLQGKRI